MPGIIPDQSSGALVVRNESGVCQNPANVLNAYCPPADFVTTCTVMALPSDCNARVTAGQINALVSEMLCLAVAMTPEGTWNCASTCNLSAAFQAWVGANGITDGETITGEGTNASPYAISPDGVAEAICADASATQTIAACLISSDLTNIMDIGNDGKLRVTIGDLAEQICADGDASQTLATCLISAQANNDIELGADGKMFVAPDWLLQGARLFTYPTVQPIPSNTTPVVIASTAFNVPNNSGRTIYVNITATFHSQLILTDSGGASVNAELRTGTSPTGGTLLSSPHHNWQQRPGTSFTYDGFGTVAVIAAIPPGGQDFISVITLGQSTSNVAGSSIVGNQHYVTWYGLSHDNMN